MKSNQRAYLAALGCICLLLLLVACISPRTEDPSSETTQATTATVRTLGEITKSTTQTSATTEQSTAKGPIQDGFPNESEEDDTKRY